MKHLRDILAVYYGIVSVSSVQVAFAEVSIKNTVPGPPQAPWSAAACCLRMFGTAASPRRAVKLAGDRAAGALECGGLTPPSHIRY